MRISEKNCRSLPLRLIACCAIAALTGCFSPAARKTSATTEPKAAELEKRVAAYAHYATGIHYDLNNKPNEALAEYLQAVQSDPSHEPLALDVARRLMREKKTDQALRVLETAAKEETSSGAVDAWLALAYAQQGQTNLAIQANQKAIEKLPDNIAAYQNLSSIHYQLGQTNEALATLALARNQTNAPAEFYLGLSGLYARFGELKVISRESVQTNALELLDRAAEEASTDPLLRIRLADAYVFHAAPEKAEDIYLGLLKEYPDVPNVREKLTDVYLRSGNKEKAVAQLEALQRENPTDPQLYLLLGSLALRENKFEEAVGRFETALKLRPDIEALYYDLAGLKLSIGKSEEALTLLNSAREKFSVNFLLEFYTGAAHAGAERFGVALKHLTAAELIARTSEPARLTHSLYFQLGSAAERNKDFEAAEQYFRKSIELRPDNAEAMNYLGYMWVEQGVKLDEARTMIEKALELQPDNGAFLDSLAWALFKLNKPDEALPIMEKAIAKSEEADATLFDHLGDIYAALKQPEKAREAWERAAKIDPTPAVKAKLQAANDSTVTAP